MTEPEKNEAEAVQLVGVGTLAVVMRGGKPVGCEMVWNKESVAEPQQAMLALNILTQSQMDAGWVVRQVARAAEKEDEVAKPN